MKTYRIPEIKHRIPWIDALRGLTVISMIFYHATWDLVYIYGADLPWYRTTPGFVWQQSICITFILLSGFCQRIGTHPAGRSFIIFLCGALVTLVTVFVTPEMMVVFGVLTFLGTAGLLVSFFRPALEKVPPLLGALISLALFLLTRDLSSGKLGFYGLDFYELNRGIYANYLTAFFGFPGEGFFSTDYFPLLPWAFLFILGFFINKLYNDLRYESDEYSPGVPVLGFIGRNALVIYMIHQPLIYGLLYLYFTFAR